MEMADHCDSDFCHHGGSPGGRVLVHGSLLSRRRAYILPERAAASATGRSASSLNSEVVSQLNINISLPPLQQSDWDIQISIMSEEAEPCELICVVPSIDGEG